MRSFSGYKHRTLILLIVVSLLYLILVGRLFQLQVISGTELSEQAVKQRITSSISRGDIVGRDGRSLLDSRYVWEVEVRLTERESLERVRSILAEEERRYGKGIYEILASQEQVIYRGISATTAYLISQENLTGVSLLQSESRYGSDSMARHLVGYLDSRGTGVMGLERIYDSVLMEAGKERPIIGLTIDTRIQTGLEKILDENMAKGAVVVADATTGEILALSSRPVFEQDNPAPYMQDSEQAYFWNRATRGSYPPGSVFKIVLLATGLESNLVDRETMLPNGLSISGRSYLGPDWPLLDEINILSAFARSSNPAFIALGQELGSKKVLSMASTLGLGKQVDIGLFAEEAAGNLPRYVDSPLAMANLSMGQGDLLVTPLQMAQVMVNLVDGVEKPLLLVRQVKDSQGIIIEENRPITGERLLSEETIEVLHEAMVRVTLDGTGTAAWVEGYGSAGKTGTAESGSNGAHAWFAGFFPLENPQYVIVVLAENGGSGSKTAAPLFKEIADMIVQVTR